MPKYAYINEKVTDCINSFNGMIDYPFIDKFIERPVIDKDKIRFIYAMLSDKLPEKEVKVYALAALLVDAALNIHENVSLNEINSDYVKKNRQLTVLGGDYYCSLYYYILSKNGLISMIEVYSYSIQTVYENKMNMYKYTDQTYKQIKNNVSLVESVLLQNIAKQFNLSNWEELINEFFFAKRLVTERSEGLSGKKPPIIQALINEQKAQTFLKDRYDIEKVIRQCNIKIEKSKSKIEKILKDSAFSNNGYIDSYLEHFFIPYQYSEKVAEEG
jgi:heptaprenyl diphosphate synthase